MSDSKKTRNFFSVNAIRNTNHSAEIRFHNLIFKIRKLIKCIDTHIEVITMSDSFIRHWISLSILDKDTYFSKYFHFELADECTNKSWVYLRKLS